MIRIMSAPNNINLFFDESENKFFSENPSEIIKSLEDDCNSPCLLDRMMAEGVKKMIQDTDGKIYQLHTDKLSVHIVRITIS